MQTKEVKLATRKYILEHLIFGICPHCGYDTTRRLHHDGSYITQLHYMEYCTNPSCRFCKKAYREVHGWLIHHHNNF